jgi:hypothetical protein
MPILLHYGDVQKSNAPLLLNLNGSYLRIISAGMGPSTDRCKHVSDRRGALVLFALECKCQIRAKREEDRIAI